MGRTVGIDLGTTNSAVSVIENGVPVIIASSEGDRTVPSVVAFSKDGKELVGRTAVRQAATNPKNTIASAKRFIGLTSKEAAAAAAAGGSGLSYEIVPDAGGLAAVNINGRLYIGAEIGAKVLGKLKRDAEAYLGEEVTKAVITVPAYFDDAQRQATKDAGEIAGLEVLRIVNEPTAAALAYGLDKGEDKTILVFDLGGGTFDVSVLEITHDEEIGSTFEVKATSGDAHLGGDDYDFAVMKWLADQFEKTSGVKLLEPSTDPLIAVAKARLREAAEQAKKELSTGNETDINLQYLYGPTAAAFEATLSRATFESITADLTERCRQPVLDALAIAQGKFTGPIDTVILVGGSTRMPAVKKLVQEVTGLVPSQGVNPDEVVAAGAARQAGVLDKTVGDVLLIDVTPLTLSIETRGGLATQIIAANSTIPLRVSETFTTSVDNQPNVKIRVVQGDRPMAAQNKELAFFSLDVDPAPKGEPQVEITFEVGADGIFQISAVDLLTGKEKHVTVTSTALTKAEIEQMRNDAAVNHASDEINKFAAEARVHGAQLVEQTGPVLDQYATDMDDQNKAVIRAQAGALADALLGKNNQALAESYQKLRGSLDEIVSSFAARQQREAADPGPSSEAPGKPGPVVDAEFDGLG